MKAKEIRDLIDFISQSGLEEVNIETEEFKIQVKRSNEVISQVAAAPVAAAPIPVVPAAPAQQATAPAASSDAGDAGASDKYVTIKSPMIGTFYRSANPESAPFANVGDTVKAGQTVCIIEAMKLFNEIESEINGTIVEVLVDNAQPVEFDQPLFRVDPA
ncbi:MAG: acetyl-CoA carboxylase biotin carboxyl carrier protein [Cyclobacteriaceae bacterium]